jgi:hypothetical protein
MSSERNLQDGFFCMGNETLAVPLALFAENRYRTVIRIRSDPELFALANPEFIMDPK